MIRNKIDLLVGRRLNEIFWLSVIALLSHVVPKRKGRIAFVALQFNGKLGGNLKPVFEAINSSMPSIEAVWLAPTTETAEKVKALGGRAMHSRFFWIWPILRAEWAFVDAVRSPLGLGRFRFIQLWHGTGFKRIGTENPGRYWLGRALVRRFGRMTALLTASSIEDAERKRKSLHVQNVVITGAPRVDALFSHADLPGAQDSAPNLKVSYVPTFREGGLQRQPFTSDEWHQLDAVMASINGTLLVKRHPSDRSLNVPEGLKNIADITAVVEDVQELLASSDIIISDYSGVVTDFVALGKPIIWYHYDLDFYITSCRDFYYEFPSVLPGPFVKCLNDLVTRLTVRDWFSDPAYKERYEEFVVRFHQFRDDHSTARVLNEFGKASGYRVG